MLMTILAIIGGIIVGLFMLYLALAIIGSVLSRLFVNKMSKSIEEGVGVEDDFFER